MKLIAYYLPQFHAIPENDLWWGEGFTEWTNVRKAKPLFSGHDQPKVPADLGYYDLNSARVRQEQADLAKEAGIHGFCYWHYWFGNGKRLLEMPINEVLKTGEPDIPFCLGWANEAWKAKEWGGDANKDKTLIDQLYPGDEDIEDHFYSILSSLKDKRYITIYEKPVFVIYKPQLLPDARAFIAKWNSLAIREGFSDGLYFIGHTNLSKDTFSILEMGFDAVNVVRIGDCKRDKFFLFKNMLAVAKHKLLGLPLIIKYKSAIKIFSRKEDSKSNIFPSIIPNWDHTPRSGKNGLVLQGSTPELFDQHVKKVFESVSKKAAEEQIIFIKSWNEWGEGNYLEPDLKFGKQFLAVIKNNLTASGK